MPARKLGVSGVSQRAGAAGAAPLVGFPTFWGGLQGEVLGWSTLTARRPVLSDPSPSRCPVAGASLPTAPAEAVTELVLSKLLMAGKYGAGQSISRDLALGGCAFNG